MRMMEFLYCSVIHMRGTHMCLLALFSYPCVRNSYVHALFYNDDQHMFYIQQVTMSIGLASS